MRPEYIGVKYYSSNDMSISITVKRNVMFDRGPF